MNLRETYNAIAEDWHRDHEADTWWVKGSQKFFALLKPGDLILDVGCGGGTKSKFLVEHGFRVIGVDFSEKLIEIATREVPQGTFVVLNMKDVRELAEQFNGIMAIASLLHVPKHEIHGVLEGLKEKLEPGGLLYISVKERRANQPEEEIVTEDDYGYAYERFFSYFTREEFVEHFTDLGLEIISATVTPSGKTNWIEVIGKK